MKSNVKIMRLTTSTNTINEGWEKGRIELRSRVTHKQDPLESRWSWSLVCGFVNLITWSWFSRLKFHMMEILLLLLNTTVSDPHNSSVIVWIQFHMQNVNCGDTKAHTIDVITGHSSEFGLLHACSSNFFRGFGLCRHAEAQLLLQLQMFLRC